MARIGAPVLARPHRARLIHGLVVTAVVGAAGCRGELDFGSDTDGGASGTDTGSASGSTSSSVTATATATTGSGSGSTTGTTSTSSASTTATSDATSSTASTGTSTGTQTGTSTTGSSATTDDPSSSSTATSTTTDGSSSTTDGSSSTTDDPTSSTSGTGCTPDCGGKACGSDGCGGACGTCDANEACSAGVCVCTPNCSGKACGDDGCGGSCGSCNYNETCGGGGTCAVQVTGCGDTAGYQSGAALATHGYCETRPFRTPYQGPSTQPSPAWTFGLGTAFTGLAIAADGTIYSGTTANQLYALNPDGTQRWVALLPNPVADSPSIGRDGTVYVSTYAYPTTHVVAVDPANGMIKWSQELNNTRGGGTPLLTASNEVIVAANDIVFYSTNGVETRTIVVDDGRSTGPLTRGPAQELYAYIARNDNKVALRRYEPQSLQFPLTWEVIRNMPGIGFSSPTYAALFNNTVISPFWQDVLVTVNKNTGDATPVCCSTPTNYTGGVNVDAFGNSYVRARSGAIAKYRADLIFDGVAGPAIAGEYQDYWVGNAVLDGGGLIVGNWTDGTLRAYNAQLTLIWSLALGATQRGEATPAIAKDGTLIVPTQNGLRAFR